MDSENKAMAKHRPSSGAELVTAVVDCSVESDQVPEIRKFLFDVQILAEREPPEMVRSTESSQTIQVI